ncbi:hypothetical protein L3X38_011538 [Prunus dulcis]|uniref:CCHC-type domain-containing protein n=1 Tax=Prunus dulcis TaxID=3755 RepID=A0AAD4WJV7_PRUDU|nr:hypothetical protein L3X38_011538 [Prunus dulcis]
MIFLHRHIREALKSEYVVVDKPLILWKALGERYDHQRMQYRHSGFKKYSELVSCLLLAEQNNELLLKNHQSSPTGSAPLPEINNVSQEVNATSSYGSIHKRGRGGKRGRWQGSRKYRGARLDGLGPRSSPSMNDKNASLNKVKAQTSHVPRNVESTCHRCGAKGHWARACYTPKHLVDLYQASLKNRKVETN